MLLESGIPVGLSSNGMQIAPMNPWIHAYYATTGLNVLCDQINPGQQLTRQEVLQHFTSANRWFLGGPRLLACPAFWTLTDVGAVLGCRASR